MDVCTCMYGCVCMCAVIGIFYWNVETSYYHLSLFVDVYLGTNTCDGLGLSQGFHHDILVRVY